MEKVVRQIEKRVDVIRAFLYTDDDIVYQEVALYKVPTARLLESGAVEDIVRHHGARILEMTPIQSSRSRGILGRPKRSSTVSAASTYASLYAAAELP